MESLVLYILTDTHLKAGVADNPDAPGAVNEDVLRYYYTYPAKIKHFRDIANRDKPNLILHLGDIWEGAASVDNFIKPWNDIKIIKKPINGNHDYDNFNYAQLVNALGLNNEPETAGSVFNRSFVLPCGQLNVKFITIDTNWDSNNSHAYTIVGRITNAMFTWLSNEIGDATEDIILLFSHHSPHLYNQPEHSHFDATDALQLKNIVEDAVFANPSLQVHHFGGHRHRKQSSANEAAGYESWELDGIITFDTLGDDFPGHLCTTFTESMISRYNKVEIKETGEIIFSTKQELTWPYPDPVSMSVVPHIRINDGFKEVTINSFLNGEWLEASDILIAKK